jgi:general secretion pathway protein L
MRAMAILRVHLDTVPSAAHSFDWVRVDAAGHVLESGRGPPASWPVADALDGVLDAALGRIVALTLPPLPPARMSAAARFALEDQLAGSASEHALAVGSRNADGRVRVVIVSQSWLTACAAASREAGLAWRRLVLESDLAEPPASGWRWCSPLLASPGFARHASGAAFAVSGNDDGLPAELALALRAESGAKSSTVRVDVPHVPPTWFDHARTELGVDCVPGSPWRWFGDSAAAWREAVDLQAPSPGSAQPTPPDRLRYLRPALVIALAALVIHVVASVGQWATLRWQSASVDRELAALARTIAPGEVGDSPPNVVIARYDAQMRHRNGKLADDDAVPLLAQAAPALISLPAGSLRSLRYADGHLVLELQKQDPTQVTALQRSLQQRGLVATGAPSPAGVRLRVGRD